MAHIQTNAEKGGSTGDEKSPVAITTTCRGIPMMAGMVNQVL